MFYRGSCFISSSSKLRLFHGEGKGQLRSLTKSLCFQHDKALLVCSAAVKICGDDTLAIKYVFCPINVIFT